MKANLWSEICLDVQNINNLRQPPRDETGWSEAAIDPQDHVVCSGAFEHASAEAQRDWLSQFPDDDESDDK